MALKSNTWNIIQILTRSLELSKDRPMWSSTSLIPHCYQMCITRLSEMQFYCWYRICKGTSYLEEWIFLLLHNKQLTQAKSVCGAPWLCHTQTLLVSTIHWIRKIHGSCNLTTAPSRNRPRLRKSWKRTMLNNSKVPALHDTNLPIPCQHYHMCTTRILSTANT